MGKDSFGLVCLCAPAREFWNIVRGDPLAFLEGLTSNQTEAGRCELVFIALRKLEHRTEVLSFCGFFVGFVEDALRVLNLEIDVEMCRVVGFPCEVVWLRSNHPRMDLWLRKFEDGMTRGKSNELFLNWRGSVLSGRSLREKGG